MQAVPQTLLGMLYWARYLVEIDDPDRARPILRRLLRSEDQQLRNQAQLLCAKLPD